MPINTTLILEIAAGVALAPILVFVVCVAVTVVGTGSFLLIDKIDELFTRFCLLVKRTF